MKRIFSVLVFGAGAVILGGCPIYSGDGNGGNPPVCQGPNCAPVPTNCTAPSDCPSGYTCGSDSLCHAGDCSQWSCLSGYTCKVSGGAATCQPSGGPDSGFQGCTSDAACSSLGAGAKCLNGTCVAPADQCSDATQCNNGEQCVQGVCTPTCSASSNNCPVGYTCDVSKGVCTGNSNPCTDSSMCGGGTVCVEQHCVNPCGAGNTCAAGLVCVDGGCIPDQKPQFVCATEGKQDACASGSLCLHHNCYIACDASADAGTQCKAADKFNVCKQVNTGSGTYDVCGSTSNLGNDCDPTIGKNCAGGLICIDGFCR